jgi:hypothetical protein
MTYSENTRKAFKTGESFEIAMILDAMHEAQEKIAYVAMLTYSFEFEGMERDQLKKIRKAALRLHDTAAKENDGLKTAFAAA